MKTKAQPNHTQGKWKADGIKVYDQNKNCIAMCTGDLNIQNFDTEKANAKRIVKAVNMHENFISASKLISEKSTIGYDSKGNTCYIITKEMFSIVKQLLKQAEQK